jgi:hypothetical protein
MWSGQRSRYNDSLGDEKSEDQIPVRENFSTHVLADPGAHSASCKMGTNSLPQM